MKLMDPGRKNMRQISPHPMSMSRVLLLGSSDMLAALEIEDTNYSKGLKMIVRTL